MSGKRLTEMQAGQRWTQTTSAAQITVTGLSSLWPVLRWVSSLLTAAPRSHACRQWETTGAGHRSCTCATFVEWQAESLRCCSSCANRHHVHSEHRMPLFQTIKASDACNSGGRQKHAAKSTMRRLEAVRWHPTAPTIGAVARSDLTVGLHDAERNLVSRRWPDLACMQSSCCVKILLYTGPHNTLRQSHSSQRSSTSSTAGQQSLAAGAVLAYEGCQSSAEHAAHRSHSCSLTPACKVCACSTDAGLTCEKPRLRQHHSTLHGRRWNSLCGWLWARAA